MRDAERLVLRQLGEIEVDLLEPGERAFRAHQEMGEVRPQARGSRREMTQVVAGDVP